MSVHAYSMVLRIYDVGLEIKGFDVGGTRGDNNRQGIILVQLTFFEFIWERAIQRWDRYGQANTLASIVPRAAY